MSSDTVRPQQSYIILLFALGALCLFGFIAHRSELWAKLTPLKPASDATLAKAYRILAVTAIVGLALDVFFRWVGWSRFVPCTVMALMSGAMSVTLELLLRKSLSEKTWQRTAMVMVLATLITAAILR